MQEIKQDFAKNFKKHLMISRERKMPRIESWRRVDKVMYSVASEKLDTGVIYVPMGKSQGFKKTLLSKIDGQLTFKYKAQDLDEKNKVDRLNALKDKDQNIGRWDWLDLLGKDQAVMYGRAIYFYTASSPKGEYKSELSIIDCLDFHIDPMAGGINKENALWLGWGGIQMSEYQLRKLKESGGADKEAIERVIQGCNNITSEDQEHKDQSTATIINGSVTTAIRDSEYVSLYRWFETIDDIRYTGLITDSADIIQIQKVTDIWSSGLYPIWTWAVNPSAREFWTLSDIEVQLGVFVAQEKSISQAMENNEKINNPQKVYDSQRVRNIHQLRYSKSVHIEVDGGDVNTAVQTVQTPQINTALAIYDKLEQVQGTTTAITPGVKGMAEEDKVAIYEGNMQQSGDILGLMNRSYAEGYYDMAKLYYYGVIDNLSKKVAVKMLGKEGLQKISRKDIKSNEEFNIIVQSSQAESQSNTLDIKNKTTFLAGYKGDQGINQKELFRYGARIAGFEDDEIKEMEDLQGTGTNKTKADAYEIFDQLIKGDTPDDYRKANTEFIQTLIDLYTDKAKEIDPMQAIKIEKYIQDNSIIMQENAQREMASQMASQGQIGEQGQGQGQAGEEQPINNSKGASKIATMGQEMTDPQSQTGAMDLLNP
jgi:hypothetical protein